MASSVWKGYISFGLVSVPIRLYAAARESHVSFNQIHTPCGSRIRQQLVCPVCDRPVERTELSKGFEVEKDTYVIIAPDELKALEAASSNVMEIQQFVDLAEVDPIFYQTSYYTVPEEPGRRAYALLMQGMQQLGKAAIARITMHGREQIVLIRPYDQGIVLHTLYFPAEVREISEYGQDGAVPLQPQEVALAEQFMGTLTAGFNPESFTDTYRDKVMALVESKRDGALSPAAETPRRMAPVIDLMEALKRSLAAHDLPAPATAPADQPTPASRAAAARKPAAREPLPETAAEEVKTKPGPRAVARKSKAV